MKDRVAVIIVLLIWLVGGLVIWQAIKEESKGVNLDLKDMHQVQCDDIVGRMNAYTGKRDLVCEIHMQQEDDNMIILKEN